jgi:hypothetical protein
MVLRRGETVSFEDGVHIQRFEPLDVLKAETRCSLLTLYLEPESDPASKDHRSLLEKVSRVVALGEVTFSGEGRQGSCARLTFHPETRVLTLRGDEAPARLRIVLGDGRVLIRNARCIEYNLETDHLRAYELDTRVRQGDG